MIDFWFLAFIGLWTFMAGCICFLVDKANRAQKRGPGWRISVGLMAFFGFPFLLLYHTLTVGNDELV